MPHTAKEKLDFLKNEYGIGGGNSALSHNFMSHVWTDGKGIRYDKPNCTRIEVPWAKVVKYYDALMESGRFAPPEEKEQEATTVIDADPIEETPGTAKVKEPEAPDMAPPIAHREVTQCEFILHSKDQHQIQIQYSVLITCTLEKGLDLSWFFEEILPLQL